MPFVETRNSKELNPTHFVPNEISWLLLIFSRNLSLQDLSFSFFFIFLKSKSVSRLVGDLFNVFPVSGNSLV